MNFFIFINSMILILHENEFFDIINNMKIMKKLPNKNFVGIKNIMLKNAKQN